MAQLDIDAQKQSGGKPVSQEARDQYFGKNVSKYPSLNAEQKPHVEEKQNDVMVGVSPPVKQPAVRIIKPAPVLGTEPAQLTARPASKSDAGQKPAEQPAAKTVRPAQETDMNPSSTVPSPAPKSDVSPQRVREQRVQIDRPVPAPVATSRPTPAPAYNFSRMNNAQEYQRNIWEQAQPTVRARPQQPQSAPRPQAQQPVRQAPVPQNRPKDK